MLSGFVSCTGCVIGNSEWIFIEIVIHSCSFRFVTSIVRLDAVRTKFCTFRTSFYAFRTDL
jgi:hypothetical protein